jgi:hypothetical protein
MQNPSVKRDNNKKRFVTTTRWHPVVVVQPCGALLLLVSPVEALRNQGPNVTRKKRPKSNRFDRIVQTIFDDADANKDGRISFDECYELVLKLYINLNRQGSDSATNSWTRFSSYLPRMMWITTTKFPRHEFQSLSQILVGQAATRLVAHKVVTLLCAPLLAEWVVRHLQHQSMVAFSGPVVGTGSNRTPSIACHHFQGLRGRTVVIIAFVATLGNIIIDMVNRIVDLYTLKENKISSTKSSTDRRFGSSQRVRRN